MYLNFTNADPQSNNQINFSLEVSSDDSVLDIKTRIQNCPVLLTAGGHIPSTDHITLFFNNQRLHDDQSVTSYGIDSNSTIEYIIYDPYAYSYNQYSEEPVRRIQTHSWLSSSYVSPAEEEDRQLADSFINYGYDPYAYGQGASNNYYMGFF